MNCSVHYFSTITLSSTSSFHFNFCPAMFMRGILACAIFGSFVLAVPFNHTTGVVNDKQEVRVYDGNRSLVPHGNYNKGAARNVSLYDDDTNPVGTILACAHFAAIAVMLVFTAYIKRSPIPPPPAPPAPPAPVIPQDVMLLDSVRCLQVLQTNVVDGCTDKRWQATFGYCKCVAMFGSEIDNKGTGTSGLFQMMTNAIKAEGLRDKNAFVIDFGAGTPHLIGVGVGCGPDWTGLLDLFTQWESGNPASGGDEQKTIDAKIVVRARGDELKR
ncbi:MAG: hypothetical protein J3Q66DRAFT_399117 [Benniella sp.]|nr:MAG: hypothetical protein J3Q66DRAFT_399117 [Benniella sp.]